MNKKTVSKFSVYFSGLLSRLEENRDYFKDITLFLKSGTKTYPSKITLHDGGFLLDHQAVQRVVLQNELTGLFEEALLQFESAVVEYNERGARILIEGDDKAVRLRHADPVSQSAPEQTSVVNTGREYVVNPALAKELLTEIGILAKNGKIKNDKIRKYNQIDYFVELMGSVLKELNFPEDRELVVMDAACGKSYLSFVMNFYLREILKRKCRFVGVDYSQTVIDGSKRIAERLGYQNMTFIREDLTTYTPEIKPDIVLSLHACDTATDMALGLGIRTGAKAIISVPCCHKDILKQYSYPPFEAITKHGILKARLADTLTDGLRAAYLEASGYKVSMIEYISPLETPKNIMIRAIFTGKRSEEAHRQYETLKEMLHVQPAIERFVF